MIARQALLLSASPGAGFRPVCDSASLALLPFYNAPVLDVAVVQLAQVGVERVSVTVGASGDPVARHVASTLTSRHPGIAFTARVAKAGCDGDSLSKGPLWVVDTSVVFLGALHGLAQAHAIGRAPVTWLAPSRTSPGPTHEVRAASASGGVALTSSAQELGAGSAVPSDILARLVTTDGARAWRHAGFWADVSTPEGYLDAHRRGWAHLDQLLALGLHQR